MDLIECFGDERELSCCLFCGGTIETVDHCPSKAFLDEPYPEYHPAVPACKNVMRVILWTKNMSRA